MNLLRKHWKYIPVLSLAVLLSGCLGDDDSTPAAATLSGIAATGAPIVGGLVTVKCATGTATDPQTENDGKWEVPVAGLTLPCAVEVSGGTVNGSANPTPYYSMAISVGTVNITPLTSMIVAEMASNTDLATWFVALNSGAFANINSNALQNAQTAVTTAIAGLSTGLGSLNPFTSTFTAASGNQMDDILEALAESGATYAQIVTALVNNANLPDDFSFSYTPPATGGGGGTNVLTCDTTQFQPNSVHEATEQDRQTYAGVYTGDLYSPNANGDYVAAAGEVTFSSSGMILINGQARTVSSICLDNTAGTLGITMYVHFDGGHVDLWLNDTFSGTDDGAAAGGGAGGNNTLVMSFSVAGVGGAAIPTITLNGIPAPASQAEFCGVDSRNNDTQLDGLRSLGGLTITGCSFSNSVGTIDATVSTDFGSFSYSVTYTYS